MALTQDGRLFGWGWNAFGQCGLGTEIGRTVPMPRLIGRFTGRRVAAVACGAAHTVALVDAPEFGMDGRCCVYSWGAHGSGQLGHDEKEIDHALADQQQHLPREDTTSASPREVPALRGKPGYLTEDGKLGIKASDGVRHPQPLSCGVAHTALVADDHSLWTWGSNEHGQCGRVAAAEAKGSLGVNASLAGVGRGLKPCSPGRVHALDALNATGIVGVACGGGHTLVLTITGAVLSFGLNATGQLGDGTHHRRPTPSPLPVRLPSHVPIASVCCGEEFSAAVGQDGSLHTWGFGGCGQLGLGQSGSMRLPTQVACPHVAEVACGLGHVLARTPNEELLAWGFAGTWQQAAAFGEHGTTPTGGGGDSGCVAPRLLPMPLDLSPAAFHSASGSSAAVAPVFAHCVGAGRFFSVFIGEPVEPMEDTDAALLIQTTFRRDRAKRQARRKRREEEAATLIGGHASEFLARRALLNAGQKRVEDQQHAAATAMQAQQRRRIEARRVASLREERQRKEREKEAITWATDRNAASSTPKGRPPEPAPPPKRIGGGFQRRSRSGVGGGAAGGAR